jgi:hypothetical protein
MDNGDIYIWGNTAPALEAAKVVISNGRRRLSKISCAHKGGVTSLCHSSQGHSHRDFHAFLHSCLTIWSAGLLSGGCDGRIKLWSLNNCAECQVPLHFPD